MPEARLPSLAVGNGRLLVTSDAEGQVLSACWPCIDSPNQLGSLDISPRTAPAKTYTKAKPKYVEGTNISSSNTPHGLRVLDTVIDSPAGVDTGDVFVRRVCGPHPALSVHLVPELDGRPGAQTIYWDEDTQALLAFCRHNWLAVGSSVGNVEDFHCGRRGDESAAAHFLGHKSSLPGERIALRSVDGLLFLKPSDSEQGSLMIMAFGRTREHALATLQATRNSTWKSIEQQSYDRSRKVLEELKLSGWNPTVHQLLQRSSLVLDLLTNRETGGLIAGPDVQSGIESAPGYAAVWGRDAAWTLIGALSLGHIALAKKMLCFAVATQSPEGLWLHRHHTDHSLATSWGLHQIDETGIYLFSFECYLQSSGDLEFIRTNWPAIARAAEFLLMVSEKDEFPSVDLWEERDGYHLYTVASTIAGLRSAAHLAGAIQLPEMAQAERWKAAADATTHQAASRFWDRELGRFVASIQVSAGLPMVDSDRPELSAKVQNGRNRPTASLPAYPNWRDAETEATSIRHDVSILSLAVPFSILSFDDPRVASSAATLKSTLWNKVVGGCCRYEGDSYGGGNPWPLATLWLAIYEGVQGNLSECRRLVDWVATHTTHAGLVPEQVHRKTGEPVAAVPLSWSHAMVAIAVAAASETAVWKVPSSTR